ncbi:hypothetical protein LCGC14_1428620, partial [marine sediment metagenome]
MNWYKQAQQGLLFYPWNKSPNDITQNIRPKGVDSETGENIYTCHQCGEDVLESDANWYREQEQPGENLQLPSYNQQQITQGITEITQYLGSFLPQLDQYIKEQNLESKRNSQYDYGFQSSLLGWEIQVPQLPNIINKYPALGDICAYEGRGYWRESICNLIKQPSSEINGKTLDELREIISNPSSIIEEYNQYSGQKFEIDYNVPVCEECWEGYDKCEFCDKIIPPGQTKYETTWDEGQYVCDECIENGRADICMECSKADSSDDMHYQENISGSVCSDCYKGKSAESIEWAEEAVSNLNIPICKNLPIDRK